MDPSRLESLRDQRTAHQRAADRCRDELHTLIRSLPPDTDKRAIERASGISRTTVYRLLAEGTTISKPRPHAER